MPVTETEEQLLPMIGPPWKENEYGVKFCPVRVPVTSPTRYVSYQAALNLRLPGEHTGDWHKETSFFTMAGNPHTLILAGPGGWGDSTPSLGSKGVRDMAHILAGWVIPPDCGPVWGGQPLPRNRRLRGIGHCGRALSQVPKVLPGVQYQSVVGHRRANRALG